MPVSPFSGYFGRKRVKFSIFRSTTTSACKVSEFKATLDTPSTIIRYKAQICKRTRWLCINKYNLCGKHIIQMKSSSSLDSIIVITPTYTSTKKKYLSRLLRSESMFRSFLRVRYLWVPVGRRPCDCWSSCCCKIQLLLQVLLWVYVYWIGGKYTTT